MKTLKYFSFFLFALVLGAGFASCSDDDENVNSSAIVGKWEVIYDEGYEVGYDSENPEYKDEWGYEVNNFFIVFNNDGTGYSEEYGDKLAFSWALNGNKLTASYGSDHDDATVLKLTDSELLLEFHEKEGHYEYYEKMSLRKVK